MPVIRHRPDSIYTSCSGFLPVVNPIVAKDIGCDASIIFNYILVQLDCETYHYRNPGYPGYQQSPSSNDIYYDGKIWAECNADDIANHYQIHDATTVRELIQKLLDNDYIMYKQTLNGKNLYTTHAIFHEIAYHQEEREQKFAQMLQDSAERKKKKEEKKAKQNAGKKMP